MTFCKATIETTDRSDTVILDGHNLNVSTLMDLSEGGHLIELDKIGYEQMTKSRNVVEQSLQSEKPIYGLTTGLGAKVSEKLEASQLEEFSRQTLRGRAHAIGEPLPVRVVRAAMIIRLNSLLKGMSGASPAIADHLLLCIEKSLTPLVGGIGSIGASDLCLGATMGLSLIGEGFMVNGRGAVMPSSDAMSAHALRQSVSSLKHAQTAGAMTMEAFRSNLSPLGTFALTANPQPGQLEVASQLRKLLGGSGLWEQNMARKLQDPLSIRNIVQVHGAMESSIQFAKEIIEVEINASSDNL